MSMRIINNFYNDGFGLDLFPGGSVVKINMADDLNRHFSKEDV